MGITSRKTRSLFRSETLSFAANHKNAAVDRATVSPARADILEHVTESQAQRQVPLSVGWYDPAGRRREKAIGATMNAEQYSRKIEDEMAAGVYGDKKRVKWEKFREQFKEVNSVCKYGQHGDAVHEFYARRTEEGLAVGLPAINSGSASPTSPPTCCNVKCSTRPPPRLAAT
jgi:hypothetical protein